MSSLLFPDDLLQRMIANGLLYYDGQRYHLHDSIKKALPVSPVSLTSAIAYFQNLKQKDPVTAASETPLFEHLNNIARQLWSPPVPPSPNDSLKKLTQAGLVRYDGQRYYLHDSIKKALPVSPVFLTSAIAYFQNLKQKDPVTAASETPLFEHLNNTARQLWSSSFQPSLNNVLKQLTQAGLVRYDGQRYYLHDSIKKALPVSPVFLTSAIAYFENLKQKDPIAVISETPLFDHLNNTARQLWSPTVDSTLKKPKPKLFNKIKEFCLKQGGSLAAGLAIGHFLTPLPSQCPTFSQVSEQQNISKKSPQNPSHPSENTNPEQIPLISSGISTSETRPSSPNFPNNSDNRSPHSSIKKSSAKITLIMTVSHIDLKPLQILQQTETDRQTKFFRSNTDSVASLLRLTYNSANSVLLPSTSISFTNSYSATLTGFAASVIFVANPAQAAFLNLDMTNSTGGDAYTTGSAMFGVVNGLVSNGNYQLATFDANSSSYTVNGNKSFTGRASNWSSLVQRTHYALFQATADVSEQLSFSAAAAGLTGGTFTALQLQSNSASAVPEPLTILGAITAAGVGVGFKRKLAKSKKEKDQKDA